MGTGKTMIGASAAYLAGFRRILVLCPPHLTRKWKREVEETVPLAQVVIVGTTTDLERLRRDPRWPLFVILSRERAKLSYRWKPAVLRRPDDAAKVVLDDEGEGHPTQLLPWLLADDRRRGWHPARPR